MFGGGGKVLLGRTKVVERARFVCVVGIASAFLQDLDQYVVYQCHFAIQHPLWGQLIDFVRQYMSLYGLMLNY